MAPSSVTLLLGPQTRLGTALNDAMRAGRRSFANANVHSVLGRITSKIIRGHEGGNDMRSVRRDFGLTTDGDVIISAISLLGSPAAAFHRNEMFPDAELRLNTARSIFKPFAPKIVLTLEPIHHFFFSTNSQAVFDRITATPWEQLYELSWADLVDEVSATFPASDIVVVAPKSLKRGTAKVVKEVFGPVAAEVDQNEVLKRHLTLAGSMALDRLVEAKQNKPAHVAELMASFPDLPNANVLRARTGIDPLTSDLLTQRFEEDLKSIKSMPSVRVI